MCRRRRENTVKICTSVIKYVVVTAHASNLTFYFYSWLSVCLACYSPSFPSLLIYCIWNAVVTGQSVPGHVVRGHGAANALLLMSALIHTYCITFNVCPYTYVHADSSPCGPPHAELWGNITMSPVLYCVP